MTFRKIIFWLHLTAGVVAGSVILIMSATGVALAFEKEIIAWAERDVRRITPPAADATRKPLDELIAKVREKHPEARPSGVTVYSDATIAVLFSSGRTNGFHVNPYSGEVQPQGAKRARAFMQAMIEWHRYLGRHDTQRPAGKAITGACNAAFVFLGLTGLYLWLPRQWTKTTLRAIAVFNGGLSGKARDWNWHNVIGLWCGPLLVIIAATAMPISYRWATDVIYKITRSQPPAQSGPAASTPEIALPTPPANAKPLSREELVASVQKEIPQWSQITLRIAGGARTTQPVTFAVKQSSGAPRFATAQLTLDPFTGAVLRAEKYSDYNTGRRVRSWMRFLHTGEALGPVGQVIAGVASLGGVVLVYTGFALAIRRFLRRNQTESNVAAPALETMAEQ